MDFAGLVPGDTPFENQTKSPPPGVGPFKITSVADRPQLRDGEERELPRDRGSARRRSWTRSRSTRSRRTRARSPTCCRTRPTTIDEPPGSDALREFREQAPDRYRGEVTNSTYYYFLNQRVKPFDNPQVRQAVNFAIDKRALARLFGGLLTPGCNFLPPGMQGYQKIDPCPYGDPKAAPDIEKAKQMIQEAGVAGQSVTVYGNDEELDAARHGVPRRRPRADRAQAPAADRQRRRVLPDDRQPEDEGRSGLRELVPGLPAPVQLHVPRSTERRSRTRTTRTSATWTTRRSTPCSPRPTRRTSARRRPSTPPSTSSWSRTADVVPYGHRDPAVHHVGPDGLPVRPVPPGAAGRVLDVRPQGLAT